MAVQCLSCGGDGNSCELCAAYHATIAAITEGTVNNSHFRTLLEALGKSTKERVHRHSRGEKAAPTERKPILAAVPKRVGDNNPIKGRGKRYGSGKPAKERQNRDQKLRMSAGTGLGESKAVLCLLCGSDNVEQKKAIGTLTDGSLGDVDYYCKECKVGFPSSKSVKEAVDKYTIDHKEVADIAASFSGLAMPGYGNAYVNDTSGAVWFEVGDSDDDLVDVAKGRFKAIRGVKSIDVQAEARPKDNGWVCVYPESHKDIDLSESKSLGVYLDGSILMLEEAKSPYVDKEEGPDPEYAQYDKYCEYKCPHCEGGKAYTGAWKSYGRCHYRGSAICAKCGEGFAACAKSSKKFKLRDEVPGDEVRAYAKQHGN